jgi:hypothetical protein
MVSPTAQDHFGWLERKFPGETIAAARSRFNSASGVALLQLAGSPFWQAVLSRTPEWEDTYFRDTAGFQLFASADRSELVRKSADSLLDKVYRKNVVTNRNWPEAPEGGWITQRNWYTAINDIIRSVFVVKYLDGVSFLTSALTSLCEDLALAHSVDFEARDEGYYAAHFYVTYEVEIPQPDWDTEKVPLKVELQVTTQLQDAIRKLTHEGYVSRRSLAKTEEKWQWDYTHPDFTPNYLGHILHYVEGMIMEVRDRRSK